MKINTIIVLFLVFAISSCGNKSKNTDQQQAAEQASEQTAEKVETKSEIQPNHPGKKVYNSVCLACHMADGSGVPGMHPPLIESDFVNGDKKELIKITLEGLSGKIEVNGETYNSIMPPHSHLSNKEIADVLTYIRGSFGNNSSEITPEEVQEVRNSL
jgi:mono/diheme cytochrome c family protein